MSASAYITRRPAIRPLRSQSSVGKASANRATPPLPTTAVEYWHSELGVTVSTGVDVWTGQIAGKTAPFNVAGARPAYGVDGSNFRGRNVVQCSSNATLYNAAATMFLINTRPWTFQIFRYRTNGSTFALSDFGSPTADAHMMSTGGGPADQLGGFINGASVTPNVLSTVLLGTTVHSAQLWCVGADANIQVDSTLTTAVAGGGALAAATAAIGIGQTASGTFFTSESSHAFLLCCSALPSATEIANLMTWARAYWGVP